MNAGNGLPTHDQFAQGFMLLVTKWFCHDVNPVKICMDFDNADETLFDLVFEMMRLKGYMFGVNFGGIL
jgi:hypothetical protein